VPAATIEVVDLEDLVCEGSPPCETLLLKWAQGTETTCGKPSTYRVKTTCSCGKVRIRFLCASHFAALKAGGVRCYDCPNTTLNWSVT
jgi:hypothetical protein